MTSAVKNWNLYILHSTLHLTRLAFLLSFLEDHDLNYCQASILLYRKIYFTWHVICYT